MALKKGENLTVELMSQVDYTLASSKTSAPRSPIASIVQSEKEVVSDDESSGSIHSLESGFQDIQITQRESRCEMWRRRWLLENSKALEFVASIGISSSCNASQLRYSSLSQFNRIVIAKSIAHTSNPLTHLAPLDPDNLLFVFRESDELTSASGVPIKVRLDPTTLEFQSAQATIVKNVSCHFKASNGNRQISDFYLSAEPSNVFQLRHFHLRLQADGMVEIPVHFQPAAMDSHSLTGSLNVIDDTGRVVTKCGVRFLTELLMFF